MAGTEAAECSDRAEAGPLLYEIWGEVPKY